METMDSNERYRWDNWHKNITQKRKMHTWSTITEVIEAIEWLNTQKGNKSSDEHCSVIV